MIPYGKGSQYEDQPFFENLADASGWVWTIPLHGDVVSVGVVRNQAIHMEEKKKMGVSSTKEFYLENLKTLVPGIKELMANAELVSEVKSASDWSYSASSYASPNVRVVGDAGCFIDPFFSSGVHLAFASGLSAAATICAAKRGDCDETTAADWHSKKVAEGYTRFLLVVLSALKQIKDSDDPVLTDWDEATFERAFAFFRPSEDSQPNMHIQLLTIFSTLSYPGYRRRQGPADRVRNLRHGQLLLPRFHADRLREERSCAPQDGQSGSQ